MRVTKTDLQNMVGRLNSAHGIVSPEWNTVGSYRLYRRVLLFPLRPVGS